MKSTKKQRGAGKSRKTQEDLAPEYRFVYDKSRPNRFAGEMRSDAVVVVLAPDVAEVFRDSRSVNDLLRAIIAAVKRPRRRKSS